MLLKESTALSTSTLKSAKNIYKNRKMAKEIEVRAGHRSRRRFNARKCKSFLGPQI